jgi:hypothetical protein
MDDFDSDDEDYVSSVDARDVIQAIRDALPDHEEIRAIFDLSIGQGEIYQWYSDEFGTGEPKITDIERFLGISQRTIRIHKSRIKIYCLYYGLTPT